MATRERSPTLLQELDVPEPAAVGLPPLLEADGGGETFLDGGERRHLALDVEVLDREPGAHEHRAGALLVTGEARRSPRLAPLIHVQRHEGDGMAGDKGARGTFHEG